MFQGQGIAPRRADTPGGVLGQDDPGLDRERASYIDSTVRMISTVAAIDTQLANLRVIAYLKSHNFIALN